MVFFSIHSFVNTHINLLLLTYRHQYSVELKSRDVGLLTGVQSGVKLNHEINALIAKLKNSNITDMARCVSDSLTT